MKEVWAVASAVSMYGNPFKVYDLHQPVLEDVGVTAKNNCV